MTEPSRHVLLVEDETPLRQAIAEQLTDRGFQVEQAESGEAAIAKLADFAFDIILTDLRLPGIDGSAVVEAAVARYPDIVAIVITGYGTVKDAVEAIKRGARDFVSKPFQIDELLHVLDSALEQRRLRSENEYLRAQLEERYRFQGGIVGKSRAMAKLFQLLETVAATSSTILVTGETGSGKEVVARAIHQHSPRHVHRFVAVNCSAIPETLLEAELFGHVRGAFTGAIGTRQGRFEQAHKGTLFLDEVGTMSAALQMKLLRVLQEREFERIGDIAHDEGGRARHRRHPQRPAPDGGRRSVPRGSVLSLERHPRADAAAARAQGRHPAARPAFSREVRGRLRRRQARAPTVSQEAMRRLMAYHWPGNVRQLENAIERAVAFSAGRSHIDVVDLPAEVQLIPEAVPTSVTLPEEGIDLGAYIGNIERELIALSLERTSGNKGQAARLLNLNRTTLVEKLKRLAR